MKEMASDGTPPELRAARSMISHTALWLDRRVIVGAPLDDGNGENYLWFFRRHTFSLDQKFSGIFSVLTNTTNHAPTVAPTTSPPDIVALLYSNNLPSPLQCINLNASMMNLEDSSRQVTDVQGLTCWVMRSHLLKLKCRGPLRANRDDSGNPMSHVDGGDGIDAHIAGLLEDGPWYLGQQNEDLNSSFIRHFFYVFPSSRKIGFTADEGNRQPVRGAVGPRAELRSFVVSKIDLEVGRSKVLSEENFIDVRVGKHLTMQYRRRERKKESIRTSGDALALVSVYGTIPP
ncbi:hypothetical protein EDD18DRAFT_1328695 [Armillaria luteobubalina]|uniref:Uncharacterized protein n=1 Tax=Armillaria luteobubalina TaxID=153913 RepID=A0AA39QF81_9AGAR|nr:hypothetical protein EDD18DRAFT_1328695 [Armillaria luteobubalina]